jgi:hypothetical protein
MVQVETYLEVKGALVPAAAAGAPIEDVEYIRGAIDCTVNGHQLLTVQMVDLVDQLWAYLADGMTKANEGKAFSCYFPDQPIKFELEPLSGGLLRVTVKARQERTATVAKREFLSAMARAGRSFYGHLVSLIPSERATYTPYMEQLEAVALDQD